MVQRRAIRWTLNSYLTYDSVYQMQFKRGLRTLEQERADARVIMIYKIVQGLFTIPLLQYFEQPSRLTWHIHPHTLHPKQTTASYYKPVSEVTLPTLHQFSLAVKSLDHLLFQLSIICFSLFLNSVKSFLTHFIFYYSFPEYFSIGL